MPKQHNNRAAAIGSRLARQRNGTNNQADPKRLELLEKILEESSSPALNDGANQTNAKQALEIHSRLLDLIDELKAIDSTNQKQLPIRNEESWTKFFDWVDEELKHEPDYIKITSLVGVKKLVNQEDNDGEYSLIAKKPFKQGDNIFNVHKKIMLSTETATKDIDLHDFVRKDTIASSMQNVVLVLHLLNEFSKGNRSNWYSYLSILPNKILPILAMNKDKLELLKSSAYIFEALKMIRAIARQYAYFYKRLELTNLPLRKDFTFQYYIWGVSVVCSRQNEIPSTSRHTKITSQQPAHVLGGGSGSIHALIPVLDMCNHDLSSSQAIFESSQTQLRTHRDLQVNDEITLNYGSRSCGEFYIHNGFVPEEVPNDMLPLTVSLNDKDSLHEAKVKLLKTFNMLSFGRFRLMKNIYENRHRRDPHLTMFLIVYYLNSEEMDFIEKNSNPVGVADEIYEYVQYNKYSKAAEANKEDQTADLSAVKEAATSSDDEKFLLEMKKRLESCVQDYLSKRGVIGSVLIDHTLEKQKCHIDIHTLCLLRHEKSIFESYIIKNDA